ncbi:hypothetical protein [Chloroflexus sp.]|uniref:hypothetical protein n=1 Tax=Chloroflexus sp. TaxID=1904827 RepID=UPI00262B00A9|nr:hypothetical protein [uncultured Chloroflexus sp.]
MMHDNSPAIPFWIIGLLGAIFLIGISIWMQQFRTVELRDQFARQPAPAIALPALPQLELQNLGPEAQAVARALWQQITTGNPGQPIEPIASNQRLRIAINALEPTGDGIRIKGTVTNLTNADLIVPISAFELRDSAGESYRAPGSTMASLPPGGSTPLELSVPLPPGRGLLLITNLPPDPPLEQRLLIDVQGTSS